MRPIIDRHICEGASKMDEYSARRDHKSDSTKNGDLSLTYPEEVWIHHFIIRLLYNRRSCIEYSNVRYCRQYNRIRDRFYATLILKEQKMGRKFRMGRVAIIKYREVLYSI